MVNGYTDNPGPRWVRDGWNWRCTHNEASEFLQEGQYVCLTYRDPDTFKDQQPVRIVRFWVKDEDEWADLDGHPYEAPRWALIAIGWPG